MDARAGRSGIHRHRNEVVGLMLLVLAAVALLALLSYSQSDPTWFQRVSGVTHVSNWMGRVGATLAEALLQIFGLASFFVPVVLAAVGWNRFRGRSVGESYGQLAGYAVLVPSLCALLDSSYRPVRYGGTQGIAPGGWTGEVFAGALRALLNPAGAVLVSATLLAASVIVTSRFSFARLGELVAAAIGRVARSAWQSGAGRFSAALAAVVARIRAAIEERRRTARKSAVLRKHAKRTAEKVKAADDESIPALPAERRPSIPLVPTEDVSAASARPAPVPRLVVPAGAPASKPTAPRQPPLPLAAGEPGMALPPLELLREPEPQSPDDEAELLERAQQLTRKFQEFAVEGSVVAIHPGPVVTTFEFKPDAGVKYSKMTTLVDDLCLALKAESVRIDRIPGKSTVGIEVPNRKQETIFPRDLLGSEKFRNSRSKLSLALGKDIGGEVFTSELDRMPHLLIAGATGAGKSVGLNGMIASILYKATPAEVRFIMIDTKMIELGMYQSIPHLLIPVVTDPKAASTALKWAVREMEQRYKKLASVGVRNLEQFNALLRDEPDRTMPDERTGDPIPLRHLPYIVIVIDEMADLMMVSSADVEESVMRLAQMARAVGIHLILATQRPSVDVITGTIKANFPARIAFRVSQRVDSRTIIDQMGAEHLLGRGDMLFLPPGSGRLVRLHGGFVTEPELNRIVSFLKKQAKPIYDESILKEPDEDKRGIDAGERDDMFLDAVRLVLQEGQCSITLIQRRMRLGYARAARIVDMMEQEGIVGPADGSKPREVLVGPDVLETLDAPS